MKSKTEKIGKVSERKIEIKNNNNSNKEKEKTLPITRMKGGCYE